jgi:hypothetical protein
MEKALDWVMDEVPRRAIEIGIKNSAPIVVVCAITAMVFWKGVIVPLWRDDKAPKRWLFVVLCVLFGYIFALRFLWNL